MFYFGGTIWHGRYYTLAIPLSIFTQTYCAQWLPDGQIIAGGSDNNMLRMLEQSSTSTVVRLHEVVIKGIFI
jgi:hypothetical protein